MAERMRIEIVRARELELAGMRSIHEHVLRRIVSSRERVFLTPDGAAWPEATTNAMRTFLRLLETAGIDRVDEHGRKVDIHALRHTFASRLARSGVGLAQAQKLLGHSDPKLTARVYTHLDAEDLRAAVNSLPEPNDPERCQRGAARG